MPIEKEPTDNALAATELNAMRKHHGGHEHDEDDGDDCTAVTPEQRHAAIEKIAYHFWQERGGGDSTHEEKHNDWLFAEIEYDSDSASE